MHFSDVITIITLSLAIAVFTNSLAIAIFAGFGRANKPPIIEIENSKSNQMKM